MLTSQPAPDEARMHSVCLFVCSLACLGVVLLYALYLCLRVSVTGSFILFDGGVKKRIAVKTGSDLGVVSKS